MKKIFDGNFMIAVRHTENGHNVYYKYPDEIDDGEIYPQPHHVHCFENNGKVQYHSDDWYKSLHYHLGYIINEAAHNLLEECSDYNIEVIFTPKTSNNTKD